MSYQSFRMMMYKYMDMPMLMPMRSVMLFSDRPSEKSRDAMPRINAG